MKFIASFVLLLSFNNLFSQDTIQWRPGYQLSWDDFQGQPDTSSEYLATTTCASPYKYLKTDTSLKFTVTCIFKKKLSWKKGLIDQQLLLHEQGHFDIEELFVRILRKRVSEHSFANKDWKKDFDTILSKTLQEKEEMNTQYDNETEFSRNLSHQIAWQKQIAAKLKSTERYKSNL